MRWFDPATASYSAAVTQHSQLNLRVAGMVAVVTLEQTFNNTTGEWREGIYSFPLPPDAAVRRLEMQVGERLVVGKVREREQAKALYQEARAAGKKAALVEQQRPNLFTNRIANIAPDETVTVRLEYVQQARYDGGEFALSIPTTLTPRYIPGISRRPEPRAEEPALAPALSVNGYLGWAAPTDQVPDADAITPRLYPQPGSDSAPLNPLAVEVELDAGMPLAEVQALYHEVALSRDGERYRMTLARGVTEMDRDFELRWRPVTGTAPRAALFTEAVDGQYYGLLMVLPPDIERPGEVLPREQVFVIDTSGSMGGVSIEQARQSLALALRQLRPGDTFNVIAFDSSTRALFNQPVPATRHNLARAGEFVRQLHASGGTEMMPALARALDTQAGEEEVRRLRQVIFITDGAVGNEQALFEAIEQRLGDSRLFTVGIGSAPNQWFMRKAAEAGRGFSVQVSRVEDVSARMGALFERISAPLASELRVAWPQAVEAWPARVPDLYRGEPLVQAVHFGAALPAGEVAVSGELAGRPWRQRIAVPGQPGLARPDTAQHEGVASLWARRKIAGLLALRSASTPEEEIRPRVLEVALAHQLLSPYTSFVAIEERVSRDPRAPLRASPVPNTRPRGQSPQPYAYPNTATTGPAKAFLGCLALFVALLVHVMRRPEEDRVVEKS
nr:marine proteobacterial sortase target protein [Parahaliea mediterranea]